MRFCLVVFRSRSQTIAFRSILQSYGVKADLIGTPRNISVSCGLCVRFEERFRPIAEDVLRRRKFDTFVGFFKI